MQVGSKTGRSSSLLNDTSPQPNTTIHVRESLPVAHKVIVEYSTLISC